MKLLHPNVPLLSVSVALMMSCNSLIVATASLAGNNLAEDKSLVTLPVAVMYIAVMCTSIPAAMLMQKIGRKNAFMLATGFGVLGGVLASLGILKSHFWLLVAGTAAVGVFNGFGNYFRFTAADSVDIADKGKAVSFTMLGGVVAAIAGPTLARISREWIQGAEFAGSYLLTILIYIIIFFVLTFLRIDGKEQQQQGGADPGRPLKEIALQPEYAVALICGMLGYGMMSFVMTATPLAMDQAAFVFDDTSVVIQWHVLAMFAPSFFTGNLITRFGVLKVMLTGAIFGVVCVIINLLGTNFIHFLLALFFLGLSWNFVFVGSTTLISESYRPEEKNKAQALNDFIIFSTVAMASLSSGALQNALGWQMVNKGVIPFLLLIFLAIVWLKTRRTRIAGIR